MTVTGQDVTAEFLGGAYDTLKLAQVNGVSRAVLKAGSPSCGSCQIYDGTFSRTKKAGDGVTAALLKRYGIPVFSEEDWHEA